MEAYFERNKNRAFGVEYPFYIAMRQTEAEGYQVFNHWHYHLELLYFSAGGAEVQIGNKRMPVSAGDLVLIHPCEVHAVQVEKDRPFQHYIVAVDPELFSPMPELVFDLKYAMACAASRYFRQNVIRLPGNTEHPIARCIMDMYAEYQRRETGFELTVTAQIYRLMAWLLRSLYREAPAGQADYVPDEQTLANFKRMLAYIDMHVQEPMTAAALAKMSLLSYSHFAKVFKSIMRIPCTRYLTFVRIRKAEQLLLDPRKSMSQIAAETGFSTLSYFIKQFKSANGISPKQYRKMLLSCGEVRDTPE